MKRKDKFYDLIFIETRQALIEDRYAKTECNI